MKTDSIHSDFDLTFMAGRLAEAFQKIELTTSAGITDSLNVISGALELPNFVDDQIARVDWLIGQIEYLRSRRAELVELKEEAAMEAGQ